jgi:hypothetical protein
LIRRTWSTRSSSSAASPPGPTKARPPAGEAAAELLGVVAGEPDPAGLGGAQGAQQQGRHRVVPDGLVAVDHHVTAVEQRHQRGHLALIRQQQPAHAQLRRRDLGARGRRPPPGPRQAGGARRGGQGRLGRGAGQRGQVVLVPLVDLLEPLVALGGQPDPALAGRGRHPGPPGQRRLELVAGGDDGVLGHAEGV